MTFAFMTIHKIKYILERHISTIQLSFFCILLTSIFSSCVNESITTDPLDKLEFSTDTLTIDTVFTSVGTVTRHFKILNTHSQDIVIAHIDFKNTAQKTYKINVDGTSGTSFQNVRIPANDSLYVFVEATVDPTANTTLFFLDETLNFSSNTNVQPVVLRAWAQDAYFHYGETLNTSTTWPVDKPHVIVDKTVGKNFFPGLIISSAATLTIPAGAKIHYTTSAGIICAGTLKCKGTKDNPIMMRGIRLTNTYIHAAGQWLGLLFLRGSINNEIEYTTIDESIFGVWMGFQDSFSIDAIKNQNRAEIKIKNSIIKNSYYWAIRSMNNKIEAVNSLFFTCTENLCQLALGGDYKFDNCTFFNGYSDLKKSLLAISNQVYYDPTKTTYTLPMNTCTFTNCVWASNSYKESIQVVMNGAVDSNYLFQNCVYRSDSSFKSNRFIDCIITSESQFTNLTPDKEDFTLKVGVKCVDAGKKNGVIQDINNKTRDANPDIGAYER
jgi:hypothetical protein